MPPTTFFSYLHQAFLSSLFTFAYSYVRYFRYHKSLLSIYNIIYMHFPDLYYYYLLFPSTVFICYQAFLFSIYVRMFIRKLPQILPGLLQYLTPLYGHVTPLWVYPTIYFFIISGKVLFFSLSSYSFILLRNVFQITQSYLNIYISTFSISTWYIYICYFLLSYSPNNRSYIFSSYTYSYYYVMSFIYHNSA